MALCHTLFQTKKDIELKIKLLTDINLSSLMPYEDNNFGGSLVLDFRKCWRHVQPKIQCSATVGYKFVLWNIYGLKLVMPEKLTIYKLALMQIQ